jgi:hypothetical protein
MIFAQRITYGLLALLAIAAVAAVAQPTKDVAEPSKVELREPARDAHLQLRRAMLRASLRTQPEVALAREGPANPARLLSDRERADLRQQLRQQERQQ